MSEQNQLAVRENHDLSNVPSMIMDMVQARQNIQDLQQFVQELMVVDIDYGVIPGTGSKRSLLKPGADKLCAIYGYSQQMEIVEKEQDWTNNFVRYLLKVSLINKRTGTVEGEGYGSCNSRESRYKNRSAADLDNTILKMAKKRALMDAVLSVTRSSGIFETEDDAFDARDRDEAPRQSRSQSAPPARTQSNRPATPARTGQRRPAPSLLTDEQRSEVLQLGRDLFGQRAKSEMEKIITKPLNDYTQTEADDLIDYLKKQFVAEDNSDVVEGEVTSESTQTPEETDEKLPSDNVLESPAYDEFFSACKANDLTFDTPDARGNFETAHAEWTGDFIAVADMTAEHFVGATAAINEGLVW